MDAARRLPVALRTAHNAASIVAVHTAAELVKGQDHEAALLANQVRSASGEATTGRVDGEAARVALVATVRVEQGCSNATVPLPVLCQAKMARPTATARAAMSPCRARGSLHNLPQLCSGENSWQGAMPQGSQ